jgi:HAD superfamily hydrolase (TIGR01509 family)
MSHPPLFIFDMDDVLYDYDYDARIRELKAVTGLSADELRERWWLAGHESAAEAGEFATGDEYLEAFCAALGRSVTVEDWVRARAAAMTPRPESIAAVRRAAELGRITLLTNNGALAQEHLATLAPDLADLFGDHLLTSSSYGARKPDPRVFERVLEAYRTAPSDAFFADDLEENIRGAESVGIAGHLYTSPALLRSAIEAFAASR